MVITCGELADISIVRGLSVHSTTDGACFVSVVISPRLERGASGSKPQAAPSMLWVWRTLLVAASEEVRRIALDSFTSLITTTITLYHYHSQYYSLLVPRLMNSFLSANLMTLGLTPIISHLWLPTSYALVRAHKPARMSLSTWANGRLKHP